MGRDAGKDISGEERPLGEDGSVGPLDTLGVERQVVFHRADDKVLRNALLMIRDHMENMPRTAIHWSLLGMKCAFAQRVPV
jgi:hypothetical protein